MVGTSRTLNDVGGGGSGVRQDGFADGEPFLLCAVLKLDQGGIAASAGWELEKGVM